MTTKMRTASELEAKGWRFDNRSRCRAEECGAEIEWWLTDKGKATPLDAGTLESHFATCPKAKDFRR